MAKQTRPPRKPKPPRNITPSKSKLRGMNKGVYNKLDVADQKAYRDSAGLPYIKRYRETVGGKPGTKERPPGPRQLPNTGGSKKINTPDSNGFIGAGLTGLGRNELQRRVQQHNALAQKAFESAGGGKKEALTAADVANVYRGLRFQNRAKVMKTMAEYEKIGKDYYPKNKK